MYQVIFNNEQALYIDQVKHDLDLRRDMEVLYSDCVCPSGFISAGKKISLSHWELKFIAVCANNDNCGCEDWTKKTAASIIESLEAQIGYEKIEDILFNS
jgi:hypothetical protein